jgi:hypothetical protein
MLFGERRALVRKVRFLTDEDDVVVDREEAPSGIRDSVTDAPHFEGG